MVNIIFDEIEKLKTRYKTNDPFELAESVGIKLDIRI